MLLKKFGSLIVFLFPFYCFGLSQGPLSPSISSIDNSTGTINWNNSNDVFNSNDVRAFSNGLTNGTSTYYLIATGFSFTIPSTAIIDGIEVQVERNDGGGNIKDNIVKIVQNGSILGTDNSSPAAWPTSDAYKTYGSATDLWGLSWTYTDVNSNNFGVAISITKTGGGTNTGYIDHINITVFYSFPLPIELILFEGETYYNYNLIKWTTSSEINNDYFVLEKRYNDFEFKQIKEIKGKGNSNVNSSYSYIDNDINSNISYYRLKQVDYDGNYVFSDTLALNPKLLNQFHVSLEISGYIAFFDIFNSNKDNQIEVIISDVFGKILLHDIYKLQTSITRLQFDFSDKSSGIYLIWIIHNNIVEPFKIFKN